MHHLRHEPASGQPHPLPWEIWRHASDGIAVLDEERAAFLYQNKAFQRLALANDLTDQAILERVAGELPQPGEEGLTWIKFDGSGAQTQLGVMRIGFPNEGLIVMIPANANASDVVTGLADRRQLEDELERRFYSDRPFALVFVDLDGFKQVNDQLGHASGDDALREIAQRMRHSLRDRDVVGRFGGDEFVVLLDGVSSRSALPPILARLHAAAATPLETVSGAGELSASLGFALSTDQHADPSAMLAAADAHMYANKRPGC